MAFDFDQRDIEAYVKDQMLKSEREDFEQRLQQEPELRKRLDTYQRLHRGLEELRLEYQVQQISPTVEKEGNHEDATPVRSLKSMKRYAWLVASLVVLLGIGYVMLMQVRAYRQDQVFEAYYQPEAESRGDDQGVFCSDLPASIRQSYYNGLFEQTLRLTQSRLKLSCALYYHGLANLALKNEEAAISDFKKVLSKEPVGMLKERTEWYLTLAYLINHQRENALDLLKRMAGNKQHSYQSSARKMLESL